MSTSTTIPSGHGQAALGSSELTAPSATSRTTLLYLACLILLLSTKSTGVTHWKLQNGAIAPANTEMATTQQGDYFATDIQMTDPEFAVLLRHSTTRGVSQSRGSQQRGRSSCPVMVNLPAPEVGQCSERNKAPTVAPRNPDGSGPM